MPEAGKKFDGGKPRMDLIPPSTLIALGEVLAYGADKYGDRNWEHGIAFGRVYGALVRHLNAWWKREDEDPESGLHHLYHALANVSFLIEYLQNAYIANEFDDRPQPRPMTDPAGAGHAYEGVDNGSGYCDRFTS